MTPPANFSDNVNTPIAEPPESITVDSDFVVILAALLCALICVVGLIAVARCAWLRRSGGGNRSSDPSSQTQAAANKGLKKSVLRSLPKLTFNSNGNGAAATGFFVNGKLLSVDCPICLSEFIDGDEIRILPQCGHGFHVGCIDTWLGSHSSCPSCRQILVVARCNKCGGYQDCSSSSSTTTTTTNSNLVDLEAGLKTSEDDPNRFLP
ncbi:Ring-h2 finger protein [Thalictrum thalictroides]|uniref:Ring-h2 finger protein n=1 Tax=Thalictrum thalictroides TaxID=46969 RepID=A0A7J6X964_THATH|nr:Ring-h2 finger protein [Thalictrum thalictroides]